jgi:hypothetical protein
LFGLRATIRVVAGPSGSRRLMRRRTRHYRPPLLSVRRAQQKRRSTRNQRPRQVRQSRLPSMQPPQPGVAASKPQRRRPPRKRHASQNEVPPQSARARARRDRLRHRRTYDNRRLITAKPSTHPALQKRAKMIFQRKRSRARRLCQCLGQLRAGVRRITPGSNPGVKRGVPEMFGAPDLTRSVLSSHGGRTALLPHRSWAGSVVSSGGRVLFHNTRSTRRHQRF